MIFNHINKTVVYKDDSTYSYMWKRLLGDKRICGLSNINFKINSKNYVMIMKWNLLDYVKVSIPNRNQILYIFSKNYKC